MALEFTSDVRTRHQRVDPDRWDDLYVVGDIHGCRHTLERLLSNIDPSSRDLLVFVGDLVRKGPDSAGVIDIVRSAPNMLSVRGNNEAKIIRGDKTLPELSTADREWLRSLPVAISWPGNLVVHGGVNPRKPVTEHTVCELLSMRGLEPDAGYDGPFWFDEYAGPPRVYFGHTVLERPLISPWAVGLDTGCVYGGQLTAYSPTQEQLYTVPAREPSMSRPEAKIVSIPESS